MSRQSPWRILGPWPLRPGLIVVVVTLYLSGIRNSERIASGDFGAVWFTEGISVALAVAIVSGLVMYLGVLWQRHFGLHVAAYVIFIVLTAITMVTLRIAIGDIDAAVLSEGPTLFLAVGRLVVVFLLIMIVTGTADAKLGRQIAQKQEALDLARSQQDILLRGDEFTRRQISGALHDRVQARLIATCLELQMVDLSDPETARKAVDATVAQLEEIRSVDVRRVARALSPRLSEVDLESALDELARQYEPAMKSTIEVDSRLEDVRTRPHQNVLLGAYRIIEQALLNSAGHGAARLCEIHVWADGDSVRLTVKDDGRGFGEGPTSSGFGSTLMTAWAQSLGGAWSWKSGKNAGVVLEAALSVRSSHL